MKEEIISALNEQIRFEFDSAFLYLSFSVDLRQYGLRGAGHWMRLQYHEECAHALKIADYLESMGAGVIIPQVKRHSYSWKKPLDLFEMSLSHEHKVSSAINDLMSMVHEYQDYASQEMLFYFVREQIEEERSLVDIIARLNLCGDSGEALLHVDADLLKRPVED